MYKACLILVSLLLFSAVSYGRDYVEVQDHGTTFYTTQNASQYNQFNRSQLTPRALRAAPSFYETTKQVQRAVQQRSLNRQFIGFQGTQSTTQNNQKKPAASWE